MDDFDFFVKSSGERNTSKRREVKKRKEEKKWKKINRELIDGRNNTVDILRRFFIIIHHQPTQKIFDMTPTLEKNRRTVTPLV